jgi:rhodanese-related sulfurtransferase
MPQNITTGVKDLGAKAQAEIEDVDVARARELHNSGEGMIVDIRDIRELWRDGRIPGAFHAPRGMLEFWIDPNTPYHKEVFAEDKAFIFCCAGGLRSVFATHVAQTMGLKPVYNLAGGFRAWRDAGHPVEPHPGAPEKK